MAGKKKKKKAVPLAPLLRKLRLLLIALLAALIAWMMICASIVSLNSAELPLRALPDAFAGTRILYLSDLHINSLNSVQKVNELIAELMRLNPDLLLLGGDYTSFDPIMRLNPNGAGAVETDMRDLFFLNLAQYNPPLGKFGVAGEDDNLLERSAGVSLESAMELGGVKLLRDEAVRIYKGNDSIVLVGVDDWSTGLQDTRTPAGQVSSKDCVILICHNPEAVPQYNNQPAADGAWMDAALTGHTHGGSVVVGGRELFSPLGREERYNAGWHMENSAKVLISRGVGGGFLPLRLNTTGEAHLITLMPR